MKRNNIFWISIIALIVFACHKEHHINFGFHTEISKDSEGLIIKCIPGKAKRVYLEGSMKLNEGRAEIELTRPDGSIAYSKEVVSPESHLVYEVFQAQKGCWSLKYDSNKAKGLIDIELTDH